MGTYAAAFSVAEFRALLAGHCLSIAGKNLQQLAVASLVFAATGSPLLTAVSFLLGVLPQVLVALTVMSLADRLPARAALTVWEVARAAALALMASGLLPIAGVLVLVLALGMGAAVEIAVRQALVSDVLGPEQYVTGRALLNVVIGVMQILGYAAGGVLIASVGATGALWAAAGASAVAVLINRLGLRPRPARTGSRSAMRATWAGNRALFRDRRVRGLLLAHWLPNGMIVGAEALYVPFAGGWAGALFVAAGAGMLAGDLAVGWLSPRRRGALILPLSVLLAVPYLLFFVLSPGWPALVAVAVASAGFGSTLAIQERLLTVVPERLRGQGLGLATSGMMTMQAVAAAVTGTLAELTSAGTAMALAGAGSLVLTVALFRSVRPGWRPAGTGGRTAPAAVSHR